MTQDLEEYEIVSLAEKERLEALQDLCDFVSAEITFILQNGYEEIVPYSISHRTRRLELYHNLITLLASIRIMTDKNDISKNIWLESFISGEVSSILKDMEYQNEDE